LLEQKPFFFGYCLKWYSRIIQFSSITPYFVAELGYYRFLKADSRFSSGEGDLLPVTRDHHLHLLGAFLMAGDRYHGNLW
jgi:hypothetical protein